MADVTSPATVAEATRVVAPAARDLDQSAQALFDAAHMGWGDREETSTQLWNGMPKVAPPRFATELPKGPDVNGRRVPSSDYVRRSSLTPAEPASGSLRASRLPSEARPRLPSPSIAPGEVKAARAAQKAHDSSPSVPSLSSPRSARTTAQFPPARSPHSLEQEATVPSSATKSAIASQLSAMEQLQEQLIETLERAREAEERAQRAEARLEMGGAGADASELQELREQLQVAQERIRQSEETVSDAERRAQSSDELVRQAKRRLAQASELAPPPPKAKVLSLPVVGTALGVCFLVVSLGMYMISVSPLKKQLAVQEQQQKLDREQSEHALATLKSERSTERSGLEAEAESLRSQLKAARETAAPAEAGGDDAKKRRHATADDAASADGASTRSARSIAHRYRRAKAAEAQSGDDSAETN